MTTFPSQLPSRSASRRRRPIPARLLMRLLGLLFAETARQLLS